MFKDREEAKIYFILFFVLCGMRNFSFFLFSIHSVCVYGKEQKKRKILSVSRLGKRTLVVVGRAQNVGKSTFFSS
jgi:hypothetical protein